ncbi:hypothetical protein, partial [Bacteroides sp. 519]|uniref:hypothetical protein n=1 Tax=Bacteroides sp. 519 TaxID=2302937 RepID=UPI001940289B
YSSEACIKYYIKIKCKDTEQGKDNIGDKAETLTFETFQCDTSVVLIFLKTGKVSHCNNLCFNKLDAV